MRVTYLINGRLLSLNRVSPLRRYRVPVLIQSALHTTAMVSYN